MPYNSIAGRLWLLASVLARRDASPGKNLVPRPLSSALQPNRRWSAGLDGDAWDDSRGSAWVPALTGHYSHPPEMPRRILIAKPGLDGHDRGAKVIARALRDAGFEVIYSGLHQTPSQIAETAVQEDVDAIGLSSLSGAHNTLFPKVVEELAARDSDDILVFGGGVIPAVDIPGLQEAGLAQIFTPGAPLDEIASWVDVNVTSKVNKEGIS